MNYKKLAEIEELVQSAREKALNKENSYAIADDLSDALYAIIELRNEENGQAINI